MRAARMLGSLAALAALLLGVPIALCRYTDISYLLQANWKTSLTVALDSRLLVELLASAAWLAWAGLALTIAMEFVAMLTRQRIVLKLPGTGWARPALGALLLAAVVAPTAASADPGPGPAPSAPADTGTDADRSEVSTPELGAGRYLRVEPGDELWSIAHRELGAGELWREIVELNPGLDPAVRLKTGTLLRLPETGITVATDPQVVVQEGDTLWELAQQLLGDPLRWPEIYELNRDQISDPDAIDTGWVLALPVASPTAPPAEPDSPIANPQALLPPDQSPAPEAESAPLAPAATVAPPETPATPGALTEAPTPEQVPEPPAPEQSAEPSQEDASPARLALAVGSLAAGGIIAVVTARRRAQLLARAVGRRLIPAEAKTARFWTALAGEADRATQPSPEPATPTTVVVGWDDSPVIVDLESARLTLVSGERSGQLLGSSIIDLSCAPWAGAVDVVLVGDPQWAEALDEPRISYQPNTQAGLRQLSRMCSQRRIALGSDALAARRSDPDGGDWQPVVFVFTSPLGATSLDQVADSLALGEVGVCVLGVTQGGCHLPATVIELRGDQARIGSVQFEPRLLPEPARHALLDLFATTGRLDTEPAPWWHGVTLPSNVLPLTRSATPEERPMPPPTAAMPEHPMLLVLGEVDLISAAGREPTRAAGQCLEYCAWLLANPSASPTSMLRDLMVAESTRRSNMSRLRTWLGATADGEQYLPDAYSGRIRLDRRVTSDWEKLAGLLAGGVNVASGAALREALRLVRGEVLGTLGFQWHWAQQLRTDMTAMIVDAACILADRAIEHGDQEMALWATRRGQLACPDSDALRVREIQALAAAGREVELQLAIVALNRATRSAGHDLAPELARRVQHAIQVGRAHSVAE